MPNNDRPQGGQSTTPNKNMDPARTDQKKDKDMDKTKRGESYSSSGETPDRSGGK
jgi:hypothetical protein